MSRVYRCMPKTTCNEPVTTNCFIHAKSLSSKNIDPKVIGATPKNPIFFKKRLFKKIFYLRLILMQSKGKTVYLFFFSNLKN